MGSTVRVFITVAIVLAILPGGRAQQGGRIWGKITGGGMPLSSANVTIQKNNLIADSNGYYEATGLPPGPCLVQVSNVGYLPVSRKVNLKAGEELNLHFDMEPNGSPLGEVIVTAVSRATELRKNPVPIAVVTRREMNVNASGNIIDAIIKGIPGVSSVTTGPNISKPFIRGLGYNRVLTLYDGIRQEGQQWGDEHGIEIDPYGIERAEVVKGPASLTYGSDATAGVINMIPAIPKGPEGIIKGEALTEYQSNNGMAAASLGMGYRKNDWSYSLRLTGKMARDYRNRADGRVYNTGYRESNVSVMARTDKPWGYSQVSATLYDNMQEIPDGSRDSLTRRFTFQQQETGGDDIRNRPPVPEEVLKSYRIAPLHQHIQHYRLYTHNKIKAGEGELQTTLGFQQSIRREYNHPLYPEQPGLYVVLNTINYGLQYNLPAIKGYEATLGINGMYQRNSNKNATDFPIPDFDLFDVGGYVFVKKSIQKFDISGGLRYDNRHLQWDDFYIALNPATGFDRKVTEGMPGARLPFKAFDRNYNGVTGSLGVAYNMTDKIVLKANIARGYRSPNITETGSNGLDPGARIVYLGNRAFNPEFSLQQDIGLIAYLKDVDISIELFNNHIDNYIYQSRLYDANGQPVVIVPGNVTYQYQQSEARLYGGELSVNLHPAFLSWLTLHNSLAYVTGLNENENLAKIYGDKARYLPFIPPLHYRSALRVTVPSIYGPFAKIYASLEADAYADQDRFYGADDTETFTKGYTLFNLSMGTTILGKQGKERCQLFLQASNLFNTVYQSHQNRLKYFEYYAASPNGRQGIYNMGRNISIKMIVPF